ncbi:MAG: choice-of-anchor I family protein [Wenzhouxiangellaceae bacterium]|nr:choice-of-anchor I family protein [Wenzhouxiangellaceae bacterium]
MHKLLIVMVMVVAISPLHAQTFTRVAGFGAGVEAGAEISAFDSESNILFATNAAANALDRFDLSDPANPVALTSISLASFGAGPNSVAVANGIVAVAVEADPAQNRGVVAFFDAAGTTLGQITVGALPDMVTFTPDGQTLLVANEGEPNDAYTVDPEGSISIIDLSGGVAAATLETADFTAFNDNAPAGVRIFGPGATVAQDLEPEYITTDGTTAWVSLQENNAVAVVDIASATVTALIPLGFKDHSLAGNGLDASDRDDGINIANWPVLGMYQPDSIASLTIGGVPYLFSANEGDARDYGGFSEEDRLKDVRLDAASFPDAATLQLDENLGRLNITTATGDTDEDGDFDRIVAYGARSFSVWNGVTGALVWDSGDELEQITAMEGLPFFNDEDGRSDNKGPEPEGIDVGTINGRSFAFIGLERVGGIFVYEVTDPTNPQFIDLILVDAGDERAEGVDFIPADQTPTGNPWLAVTFEVSGTVALYEITDVAAPPAPSATPIPTLDKPALLLLMLAMLGLGGIVLRRF